MPVRRLGFSSIDGDQPARLIVENIHQTPRVFVSHASDDAKSFFLDCGGKLPHTKRGGVLAFEILIDNRDGKCLEKLHAGTIRKLQITILVYKMVFIRWSIALSL